MPDAKVEVKGAVEGRFAEILTPQALEFLAALHRRFNATRLDLLARRAERQKRFDAGENPDFVRAHARQIQPAECAQVRGRSQRGRPGPVHRGQRQPPQLALCRQAGQVPRHLHVGVRAAPSRALILQVEIGQGGERRRRWTA